MHSWLGVPSDIDYSTSYTSRVTRERKRTSSEMFGKYNSEIISKLYAAGSSKNFNDQVFTIENVIKTDNTITQIEKTEFLNTLSVLKSSYQYWETAYKDNNNPWHKQYLDKSQANANRELVSGGCGFDPICVAAIDALAYSDTYW